MIKNRVLLLAAAIVLLGLPVSAQQSGGIELRGWGPRVGLSSDPDQVVGGVHLDMGEFADNIRFRPDVQVGFGDDVETLFVTAPVHYRFRVDQDFVPYAGGGIAIGFVDRDLPPASSADDTSFEIGARLTGGLEWARGKNGAFAVELSLGFGDVHDALIVGAWTFGK